MNTEKNSRIGAIVAVLFAVVVWGASFIATKILVKPVTQRYAPGERQLSLV